MPEPSTEIRLFDAQSGADLGPATYEQLRAARRGINMRVTIDGSGKPVDPATLLADTPADVRLVEVRVVAAEGSAVRRTTPAHPARSAAPTAPAPPAVAPAAGASPAIGGPSTYASWGERVVATVIEIALLLAVVLVIGAPLAAISDSAGTVAGILILGLFLYWQVQNGTCGQSPGKALLGLRVVGHESGRPIGGALGLARYVVATALSVCTCGLLSAVDYLFPLWDPRRQTLHDKAVGSVVLSHQARRRWSELLKP